MIKKIQQCQVVIKDAMKIEANAMTLTKDHGYTGRKTGKLAQSVHIVKPYVMGNEVEGVVEQRSEIANYGNMREYGGLSVPIHGQFLTVPLPGRNWGSAAALRSTGRTFVVAGKIGNPVIMYRPTKRSDSAIPVFVLRRSMEYKAQRWVSKAVVATRPTIKEIMANGWTETINGSSVSISG